ncbi:peroxiredoxin-like family protein [Paraglaciecola sp. 20A4]|uniref:peroxiredoxin-like family protein n=1 Tax=Paraglaciecola sp. 20A4 TaxID=2687288 RepID=UPI00140D53D3|nr:peroxiredoxin-like family protein [Paraglaciecola sp. 20A4]|tara:strand:- start:4303 stop:4950 length:648 start_codon:yes stop_codon:yes gene_type:complete
MLYHLKIRLGSVLLLLAALVSMSSFALDRTLIANDANNVMPLLVGHSAPNTTLQTADGAPVSLKALTMQKPTVLIFYRGGWCPYCNRQLAGLKDIESSLDELGYQILAISPETPAQLQAQKLQSKFTVQLLSDSKLNTIRGFGIGYYVAEETTAKYKTKKGVELNASDSSGHAVLPAPAVFILDEQGIIKFSYVNPNYKQRLAPELLYQAAKYSL